MNRTIKYYSKNLVPKKRTPVFACYDNKKISKWTKDDFADYIFDNSDAFTGKFSPSETFFNPLDVILDYLECIPENYARIYLYGVFDLFKGLQNYYWNSENKGIHSQTIA